MKLFFVSDLRMGGDGHFQHCDYTDEFVAFLKEMENEGPDTELIIVGDTFGFWETTVVRGVEKLDHIDWAHQSIFDQLRTTGANIKVTMMVGNHDYDLACIIGRFGLSMGSNVIGSMRFPTMETPMPCRRVTSLLKRS